MVHSISGDPPSNIMQTVLATIAEQRKGTTGNRCFGAKKTMEAIQKKGGDRFQALNCWSDLLRHGLIALENPDRPEGACQQQVVYFVTDSGEATLREASRDPINQAGYMSYLDSETSVDPVTRGYVEEALGAYRACCHKAAAVMIGAAVENLILGLRDALVVGLTRRHQAIPKSLTVWQPKTVLETVAKHLLPGLDNALSADKDNAVLRQLRDDAHARLTPIAAEFRKTRNDAGHPTSLDPIRPADVHCNLLLFPTTAKLIGQLKEWVDAHYV